MAPTSARSRIRDERGLVIVETALVLPFLVVLIFTILHLGQAVNYWNDVNQMAGEGARFAAVSNVPGDADLEAFLRTQAVTDALGEDMSVCVAVADDAAVGDPVEVRISSPFELFPFVGDLVGDPTLTSVDLNATATMRLEALPDFSAPPC